MAQSIADMLKEKSKSRQGASIKAGTAQAMSPVPVVKKQAKQASSGVSSMSGASSVSGVSSVSSVSSEALAVSALAAALAVKKKGRGRPKKIGGAMSDAERARRYRARKKLLK